MRKWKCDTCGKEDDDTTNESKASPEHQSYRGVDIGTCKGEMIEILETKK